MYHIFKLCSNKEQRVGDEVPEAQVAFPAENLEEILPKFQEYLEVCGFKINGKIVVEKTMRVIK